MRGMGSDDHPTERTGRMPSFERRPRSRDSGGSEARSDRPLGRSRQTRVVQMSSAHLPKDTRVFHRISRTLVEEGYDVRYIVPHEADETCEGVQITAVTQPENRLSRFARTIPEVLRRARAADADIYQIHDVELIPAGLILRLLGKTVIYDAHEDIRKEIRKKHWIPAPLRIPMSFAIGVLEDIADPLWSAIVVATPSIGERFRNRRTRVIQNFPKFEDFSISLDPNAEEKRLKSRRFIFLGSLNPLRSAREIVRALEHPDLGDRADLTILGQISPPSLVAELRQMAGWRHVDYLGWRPYVEVGQVLSDALAGLVLFHPAPNHMKSQPRKLFEYMAAGLPVIASDFPLWRRVVGGARCGLLVDPTDPHAIADAMREFLDDPAKAVAMGRRGAHAARVRFSWKHERPKLVSLYTELSR